MQARIRQRSLFKKKLKMENIIGVFELSYGTYDEHYRLMRWKIDSHTLIYDKDHLARGIDFSIDNNDVILTLSLPTTKEEVNLFYTSIEKMCKFLKTDNYIIDGEIFSIKDKSKLVEKGINTSISAIKHIYDTIKSNGGIYTIFAVNNPITLGKKDISLIVNNYDNFSKLLEEKQSIDAFYAAPKIFKDKSEKLFGMYAVMPNNLTIIPTEPYVSLDDSKKIDNWYILFGDDKIIKYDNLINNLKFKKYYDDNHILVSLGEKEIDDLISKYKVKI